MQNLTGKRIAILAACGFERAALESEPGMIDAGAGWQGAPARTDQGIITSRQPSDISAFCEKSAQELTEAEHRRQVA